MVDEGAGTEERTPAHGEWQPRPHPAPWRWLRWVLPLAGAGLLAFAFWAWQSLFNEVQAFYGHDSPPFWLAAILMLWAGLAVVLAARLPWARYLPRALGLEVAGGVALAFAWVMVLMFGGFGMCGLSPSEATWTDPALYAAMPAPRSLPGYNVVWSDPAPGLPFGRSADPAWGPHNLTQVWWRAEGLGDSEAAIFLDADRKASLEVHGAHSPAAVKARFLEWSAHATTADEAARVVWADAFVASNRTSSEDIWYSTEGPTTETTTSYRLHVPGPFRLEALHDSLAAAGALTIGYGDSPGARSQSAGAWAFSYSLAVRSVENGDPLWSDPGLFRLAADSGGLARLEGLMDGERSESAYRADVAALLADHGLPTPDPAQVHVSGSIC